MGCLPKTPTSKSCSDLSKEGQSKCESANAIKGKVCEWKDDKCQDKSAQTFASCAEITPKDKSTCEKANQVAGKSCVFMAKSCVEKTAKLDSFMSAALKFGATTPVTLPYNIGNDILGADHGETADWGKLCGRATTFGTASEFLSNAATNPITRIEFKFKKDSEDVKLELHCNDAGGGGHTETYDLKYSGTTLDNGALLIELDANGKTVMADSGSPSAPHDQLDFFTKTKWFVNSAQDQLKGASLLASLGYRAGDPILDFKSEADIDNAISYAKDPAKGNGWEIGKVDGKDVGAITFMFKKF